MTRTELFTVVIQDSLSAVVGLTLVAWLVYSLAASRADGRARARAQLRPRPRHLDLSDLGDLGLDDPTNYVSGGDNTGRARGADHADGADRGDTPLPHLVMVAAGVCLLIFVVWLVVR